VRLTRRETLALAAYAAAAPGTAPAAAWGWEPDAAATAWSERRYAGLAGVFAASEPGGGPKAGANLSLAPLAAAAILTDAASGQILWAKEPDLRRPVASVTKLMTMALVLDAIASGRIRWGDLVSASEAAVRTPGAQIWLELGETMTVRDLFYAVAIHSANDAAVALAEFVGGSVPHFVEMMNAKAKALGMQETHYVDPTGLDDAGYSTARDVATLSRFLVLHHPEVLQYTKTWEYRLRENKLWMVNRNRLLTRLPGVDGLKTGFTTRAGYCLAATAIRGSTRLIAVVLGAPTSEARFGETAACLQWGFTHYVTVPVAARGQVVALRPVDAGAAPAVALVPAYPFGVTVPRGQEATVRTELVLPARLLAPVAAHQPVGVLVTRVAGQEVARIPLVAAQAVPRIGLLWLWLRLWRRTWAW